MQNPYLLRTAAVVSVAAAALSAGWIGMGTQTTDEMQVEPQMVSVTPYEPVGYFPAGYELKPNPAEAEVFDYE